MGIIITHLAHDYPISVWQSDHVSELSVMKDHFASTLSLSQLTLECVESSLRGVGCEEVMRAVLLQCYAVMSASVIRSLRCGDALSTYFWVWFR